MWTPEHRQAAARRGLRYPSDLTDAEWALIEPMIPPARRGGRPRDVNVREVLNGIFYVLWTGCQWSALPKDLPPKSTAHHYFMLWDWDGTLERIHHALYVAVRDREGREASPSAAVIDSQSAKGAQKGGLRSTRRASMRARRSRGASATSSSIHSAGVVTLTAIWPACGRRRRRLCNGRHLPPLSHRVAAELAECSAGDQMALDVEEVVDGRMDGEEPLRGRGRFEPLHLSLSSSHRLM